MAGPGGVFVTGHDPDFHADHPANPEGARNILRRAVEYVTGSPPFSAPAPRMLLVTSVQPPPPGHLDPRNGLRNAGFVFEVADAGSGAPDILDLRAVNLTDFEVIVVASDHGGLLTQAELDILNARGAELREFVNGGGGLIALSETTDPDGLTEHDRFGFLPFLVAEAPAGQQEVNFSLTPAGSAMGLMDTDVNGNVSHVVFNESGGMDVIDVDAQGRVVSLAARGPISSGGVGTLMWINHLTLLAGDPTVLTSYHSGNSGVGSGLPGLIVESTTVGPQTLEGFPKLVSTALEVPPRYTLAGVRVCYELADVRSFIDGIRLAQVQDPPGTALVLLDDPTPLTDPGPVCVDSASTIIDASAGPLLLGLRCNFGDTADRIVIRGLGLQLLPNP